MHALDYEQLLRTHSGYVVAEVVVEHNAWLCGKTIVEASFRPRGVNILSVRRKGGEYIGAPSGSTPMHEGDTLIVYGSDDAITKLREDLMAKPSAPGP